MSDRMTLLRAMDGLSDEDILQARALLGYGDARPGRAGKKLRRTLLLAAVLASLLSVGALAAGRFGLGELLISGWEQDRRGHTINYISGSGLAQSPAGQAQAEWLRYQQEALAGSGRDSDAPLPNPEDEALQRSFRIYGAFNGEEAEELLSLRDRYDLRLHDLQLTPKTEEDFFAASGAGPFLLTEEGEALVRYETLYEDGSFSAAVTFSGGGPALRVRRSAVGVLDPVGVPVDELGSYEQETYAAASGAEIQIALEKDGDSGYFFYQEGDYFLTVSFSAEGGWPAARRAADRIDFSAACRGSAAEAAERVEDLSRRYAAPPAQAKAPGQALSLEDFFQAPEIQALTEFARLYEEHGGLIIGDSAFMGVYGHLYGALTDEEQAKLPPEAPRLGTGNESTEADILAVCEKYGLRYPAYKEFVTLYDGQAEVIPYGFNGGFTVNSPQRSASAAEVTAALDQPWLEEQDSGLLDWYDTGAFFYDSPVLENQISYELHYIPKGTLYTYWCPTLLGGPDEGRETRLLDTACGETVRWVAGPDAAPGEDTILYETPEAYLVIRCFGNASYIAEHLDFTRFR